MQMALLTCALACTLASMLGGCSRREQGGLAAAEQALGSAGLKVQLTATSPGNFAAQRCWAGSVERVDTVVCEYGSAEAVALGKKAGESWIGQAVTGAVLERERRLLLLADRAHADPSGKTIHKLTRAFQHAR